MAKIEGDFGSMPDRRPGWLRHKVETLEKIAKESKMGEEMDKETKSLLDDLLEMKRPPKSMGGRRTMPPHDSALRDKAPFWKPLEVDPEEEKRIKEAAALEKAERARRMEAEEVARKERERIREQERIAAERARILDEWCQLQAQDRMHDMSNDIAYVSVNTAKACVVVRAYFTGLFMEDLHKNVKKGFKFVEGVLEVDPKCMPKIKPLLAKWYKEVQMVGVPKALPTTKFDQLMAKLDKEDKAKIYKLLALKYHVDKGGDHETMVLINQVFKEA